MPVKSRILIRLIVGIVLTTIILLSGHLYRDDITARFIRRQGPKIVIMESLGVHEEVIASILYQTSRITSQRITLLVADTRYGAEEMYRRIAPEVDKRGVDIDARDLYPDAIVLTTCQYELEWYHDSLVRRMQNGAKLFCVIHHSDRWDSSLLAKNEVFISNDKFAFITLSRHVADDLRTRLVELLPHPPMVDCFVPSFDMSFETEQSGKKVFAIQGNITPGRRDYASVLNVIKDLSIRGVNVGLQIIGSGTLDSIPAELQNHVTIHSGLNFIQYYTLIGNALALLPAFGHDGYYSTTASSTIPASLISNCPLVATKRIVDTYDYLNTDGVYLQEEGESESQLLEKIALLTDQEHVAKKAALKSANMDILDMSIMKWQQWIAT